MWVLNVMNIYVCEYFSLQLFLVFLTMTRNIDCISWVDFQKVHLRTMFNIIESWAMKNLLLLKILTLQFQKVLLDTWESNHKETIISIWLSNRLNKRGITGECRFLYYALDKICNSNIYNTSMQGHNYAEIFIYNKSSRR